MQKFFIPSEYSAVSPRSMSKCKTYRRSRHFEARTRPDTLRSWRRVGFIKNRKGQNISVIVEASENQNGLAFVMHGLGGSKGQEHIVTFANAFKEKGFTVVRFDTTNTFGESDGVYENATTTNYYEDLQDVISWASSQLWYEQPFTLVGHSLGGISSALYAENYPNKVKALAPISTVVSGILSLEMPKYEGKIEEWKRTGWIEYKSETDPNRTKRTKWSHMEDRLKYDLIEKVGQLTMPVLMIVGDQDIDTPVKHQKILYNALPGDKELHIIKNAPHTFRDKEHLAEIKSIFLKWIDKIEN